jgi:quercetin dioxygenase-like cupin family protein
MLTSIVRSCAVLLVAAALLTGSSYAAQGGFESLDPKAIAIKLPGEIKWPGGAGGAEQIVLAGDPSKPGLYVILVKWHAQRNSRPHYHPNDRFITVLSGTWWVGTGRKYDPDSMKPVPAGSFVTHFANEVHYDGAKEGEAVLQIVGMGPATATGAEDK